MKAMRYVVVAMISLGPILASAEKTPRPCEVNFTVKGSAIRGKIMSTWQEFEGVDYDTAFRKVAQATAQQGWGNLTPTKDIGTITAGSQGAGLNIAVNEVAGKIRVEANITLGALVGYPESKGKKALCASVEAPGG